MSWRFEGPPGLRQAEAMLLDVVGATLRVDLHLKLPFFPFSEVLG